MLKFLYAKNFALIDEIQVEFGQGLNIITGETGAGKSILVGALGAMLGDRLSRDVIRSGAEKAIVEGEFQINATPELLSFFNENDLDYEESALILRREISANGRSRCFVNDVPVPLNILAQTGDWLVDLHGQHQHQLLLQTSRHIDYLDDYAHLADSKKQVNASFQKLNALTRELDSLKSREQGLKQSRDIFEFQLQEIRSVDPHPGEDVELEKKENVLRNAERLFEHTTSLYQEFYEDKGSLSEKLKAAEKALSELARIDNKFSSLKSECENARIIIDELAGSLQQYSSEITFDPQKLENIRLRLAALSGLKKKYGGTIDAILKSKASAENELSLIENIDGKLEATQQAIDLERNSLGKLSLLLSEKRSVAAQKLAKNVSEELANLGMPKAKFSVSQRYSESIRAQYVTVDGRKVDVAAKGIDKIEFLISVNPGEELKPLAFVASGGEISRIMLALKSLLADIDKVPVLIFDEIDIGISGRIAQAVGRSLRRLAYSHQLVCVTHLPQIASMAHHHFLVEKKDDGIKTQTMIRRLLQEERPLQIAHLFGGEHVTDAHLQSASDLIKESENLARND